METMGRRWRTLPEASGWLVVEAVLPGTTLFALLLLLSLRFLRTGFGEVRHHAIAPDAGAWSSRARLQRRWWSCTCASTGVCECLTGLAGRVCRCCRELIPRMTAGLAAPRLAAAC